ncbi:putative ferric-chelate reductase 1 [Hyperolius riggenbachi]|uniref:putative ferric-chelate reductase 1 n=1 Tax=Hyperolius riggenbachi TaxID=752182 RepID=UPI0035A32BCD
METSLKSIFLLVTIFPTITLAYPNGRVEVACTTMLPNHGVDPQTDLAPYSLTFSSTNYTGKLAFLITLSKEAEQDFRGFLIQARAPGGNNILGSFVVNGSDAQTLTCTTPNSAVSHTSRSAKSKIEVIWLPPSSSSDIQFRATVVQTRNVFWTNVLSDVLKAKSASQQTSASILLLFLICSSTLMHIL